jgi:Fe-S cluster biogenesis protein NfuA/nitrite reductase/ring-hydroxylating ferredoxin subunit
MDDQAARERIARVEALLDQVESLPDAVGRQTAGELVSALVELYGEGLARIMDRTNGAADGLLDDELVAHLLLLHDLHPVPVEDRVRGALAEVRPYLESHGGDVELVSIEEGVVRLRLEGSCSGCPSSTMTLKLAIEDAIHKAAPDVEEIVAEGAVPEAAPPLLQIQVAGQKPVEGWVEAGSLAGLVGAEVRSIEGEDVLFARIGESRYAYRTGCPACGSSLGGDSLEGSEFRCPSCGNRYDAIRAGRCLDQPQLQLVPLPLLDTDGGSVKVAVA